MKFWTAYWQDGKKVFAHGETVEKALKQAGQTLAEVKAMDFCREGFDFTYRYDEPTRTWIKTETSPAMVDLYAIQVNAQSYTPLNVWSILKDPGSQHIHMELQGKQLNVHIEDLPHLWQMKLK